MPSLNKHFSSNFCLFPWGFCNTLSQSGTCEANQLHSFCKEFLHLTYLTDLLSQHELINLRGNDQGELFFISGHIIPEDDLSKSKNQSEENCLPDNFTQQEFAISWNTQYKSSSASKVIHSLEEIRSGAFPKAAGLRNLPDQLPSEVFNLRLYLAKYSPRKITGYFGLAPINTGHIKFEGSQEQYALEIKEEGLAEKDIKPWIGNPIVELIEKYWLK